MLRNLKAIAEQAYVLARHVAKTVYFDKDKQFL